MSCSATPAGDDGGVEKIVAVGGVEEAAARAADAVAGAPDALDRRRDGGGRLDEDDPVELADVDPEFERAGGDDGLELPVLQPLLHGQADLPGERAVVRVGELLGLSFVDQAGHLLRGPAAVGKKERGAVLPDDLPEGLGEDRPPGGIDELLPGVRGEGDPDLAALLLPGLDDGDGTFFVVGGPGIAPPDVAADESGHPRERLHRRREGDPLKFAGEGDQALDGRDQVGPALRADDGMDLVEDDRGDPRQHRPARSGS